MGYFQSLLVFLSGAVFLLAVCYLITYLLKSPYWVAKSIQSSVVTQVNLGIITLSTSIGVCIIQPDATYIAQFYEQYPYLPTKAIGVMLALAGSGQLFSQWLPWSWRVWTLAFGYAAWFLLAMYGLPLAGVRMLFWLSFGQALTHGFLLVLLVTYAREGHRGSR